MPGNVSILLFDLGGVIVDIPTAEETKAILGPRIALPGDEDRWLEFRVLAEFEIGRLSPEEFARAFIEEWSLPYSPTDFLREFESWTRRLYPGAPELLKALSQRFRLAALSNSNVVHWTRNAEVLRVPQFFERAFSSHQVGWRKPAHQIYLHALAELDAGPEEVIFFDDSPPNIQAARELGIDSYLVRGIEELRVCLADLGLTPSFNSL